MPTPAQAAARGIPDEGEYSAFSVNGAHFGSVLDRDLCYDRLADAAADHERRLRGWMQRRGLLAEASAVALAGAATTTTTHASPPDAGRAAA